MHCTWGLLAVFLSAGPALAADTGRNKAEAVPALPGDVTPRPDLHQTPPNQEDVIPQTAPGAATSPAAPGEWAPSPVFNPDVVPRSTPGERRQSELGSQTMPFPYDEQATGGVAPDVVPNPGEEPPEKSAPHQHPGEMYPPGQRPDENNPEDVLPAPDDQDNRYDPLETKLDGGTRPAPVQPAEKAPRQPEGTRGVPAGGYRGPF